jgi:protein ImuB
MSKVGLASNRFTAAVAAELAPLGEGRAVARGAEAEFLAPLGIAALAPSDAAIGLLTQLGVVTVGQVSELPPGALSRTLGTEGERLYRLARGIDPTPLVPEFEQAPLSAQVSLDWQLENLAALAAYAEVLIGQLTTELTGAGMAAGNLIVEVEQQDGRLRTTWGALRPASNDRRKLLERATGLLERMKYSNGVTGLTISLAPLQPQHLDIRQIPIGDGNALTPDPLGHTLDTIRIRFGDGSIRDAAAVPGPPPEPINVRCGPDGQPGSMLRDGRWTRFESVQLHWRMEGDWWSSEVGSEAADQWRGTGAVTGPAGRKDYYQVVTRGGEILVLLNLTDRWYLHTAAKPSAWPVM